MYLLIKDYIKTISFKKTHMSEYKSVSHIRKLIKGCKLQEVNLLKSTFNYSSLDTNHVTEK